MREWRWPLLIRVYVPPSRSALADRLKVSEGDLVASFGREELGLLTVLDADYDVISEAAIPLEQSPRVSIATALDLLHDHPDDPLAPHGGLSIAIGPDGDDGYDGDTYYVRRAT